LEAIGHVLLGLHLLWRLFDRAFFVHTPSAALSGLPEMFPHAAHGIYKVGHGTNSLWQYSTLSWHDRVCHFTTDRH